VENQKEREKTNEKQKKGNRKENERIKYLKYYQL
jgi:hypothetical protein